MSFKPLISVVMPVYNAEKYLDEAIRSILDQTYNNFEFIIINDGSNDKSLKIIKKYKNQDERIVLISRENKGLIASLNEGIEHAKGKYIARMDADDISCINRFKEQYTFMEQNNLDFCGSHFVIIDEDSSYKSARIVSTKEEFINVILSTSVPFAHGSAMINKAFLQKNNLIYGTTKYNKAEDYDLWIRSFEKGGKFSNVDKILFYYRDIDDSLSKDNINYLHARKLSNDCIDKYNNEILHTINSFRNKIKKLNDFEKDQTAFFLLKTLFSKSFLKNIELLKKIEKKYILINLFRLLRG